MKKTILISICPLVGIISLCSLCSSTPESLNNQYIDYLENCVSDEYEEIPNDFYTYTGFRDWWRWPLVYPYSIHTIDIKYSEGILYDESAQDNIKDPNNGGYSFSELSGIDEFNFDCNFLLIKSRSKYYLFSFYTNEIEEFREESELLNAAEQVGYNAEKQLMTIEEYDKKVWDKK